MSSEQKEQHDQPVSVTGRLWITAGILFAVILGFMLWIGMHGGISIAVAAILSLGATFGNVRHNIS